MKIGILSRGRTNSTAVINTLAIEHNITNKSETYLEISRNLAISDYINRNYKKQIISHEVLFSDFKSRLLTETESLFSLDNFIIKIWPSMLCYPTQKFYQNQSFDQIKNQIVFNITDILKLKQYDQLYFLDKDLHHSTISWVYSKKNQLFHKKKNIKQYTPITELDFWDYDLIRFYVLEYCLQHKIKQYLISNYIPFIDITNDVQSYINNSILDIEPNNNDYKKLLPNYNNIYDFISKWYEICLTNTNNWHFI